MGAAIPDDLHQEGTGVQRAAGVIIARETIRINVCGVGTVLQDLVSRDGKRRTTRAGFISEWNIAGRRRRAGNRGEGVWLRGRGSGSAAIVIRNRSRCHIGKREKAHAENRVRAGGIAG